MSKKVETVCPVCGKRFAHYPSQVKAYCSRQCAGADQRGKPKMGNRASKQVETACPQCGKRFLYYPSWPRKYCSNVCAGKANVGNTQKPVGARYETACEQCGKAFTTVPSQHARFCSLECFGKWRSAHVFGAAHPMRGKTFNRPKDLVPLICPVCETEFLVKRSHAPRRRYCSKECMGAAYTLRNSGANSATWTGGYEPYYGPSWRPAMRFVRARDQVCQRCGVSPDALGRELDVHHRIPFRLFGIHRHAEANDPANLIALCNVCHLKEEWETNRKKA
jgi:5-methylcytosine-specific restriction endonuclease McrA